MTFLTLYVQMDSSFWFDTIKLRQLIVCIEGSNVIISNQNSFAFAEDYFGQNTGLDKHIFLV